MLEGFFYLNSINYSYYRLLELSLFSSMAHKISIRRGGYAVVFIYFLLILLVAFVAKQFAITGAYFFMASAIVAVLAGYYLSPIFFKNPVVIADENGIWTKKLGTTAWQNVKNIYIERTPRFSTKGLNKVDINLVIETIGNRSDSFDVMFLENGEALSNDIILLWKQTSTTL